MEKKKQIVFTKFSPYMVADVTDVYFNGQKIDVSRVASFCRCGASTNMPFCDGSHGKIKFSGQKDHEQKIGKTKAYVGDTITIFFNARLCAHNGACTALKSVFDAEKTPWINPNGASVEAIKAVIEKCPSGALSYQIGDTHYTEFETHVGIEINSGGPMIVKGGVDLVDSESSSSELGTINHYTLCRCGKSKNKPFCDGEHVGCFSE